MTATRTRSARLLLVVVAAVVLFASACNWRGPRPTETSIEQDGTFAYGTHIVPSSVSGFGGGTIWYPIAEPGTRFGGVAVVPGFVSAESTIAWFGPRLASHGFVVITIATSSLLDQPASRGNQLLAALDHLTQSSPVADMVDPDRLAVMGWSMGGGGALHAADARPELRAAIPLAGWHTTKDWSGVQVPTLVVACQNDSTAPIASHSIPFYESLSNLSRDVSDVPELEVDSWPLVGTKAYLEVAGGSHQCVTSPNVAVSRGVIPWLKRWVDDDVRYDQWICPPPVVEETPALSDHRSNCGTATKPGLAETPD